MKTLLLLAALSSALPAFAAESSICDFSHAVFRRSDGATISTKLPVYNPLTHGWEAPIPEGVFAEGWFEARGIDGVIGFAALAGNCGGPGCVLFIPIDATGKEVSEGGGALNSDGQDAWPGASGDPAPAFIHVDDFGTFHRECHRGVGH